MTLLIERVPDVEGHGAALLLKGDWLFVGLSDGENVGWGEASLSGDEDSCEHALRQLFDLIVDTDLSMDGIAAFRASSCGQVDSFVSATAASALEQALHDLVSLQAGVPVWALYAERPVQAALPSYATINRTLTARDAADYIAVAELALNRGFRGVKCAPFERVSDRGDQVEEAKAGLAVLELLRDRFPQLDLRVDCHERFTPAAFCRLLPRFDELGLTWIEAPCPIGPTYADIRERAQTPIAAGELFFGARAFAKICENGWADVVMPDVKHVGGIGPALEVCELATRTGVEVSFHNASGPVATLGSIHCGALSAAVTSVEIALRRTTSGNELLLAAGLLPVPGEPGWGLGAEFDPALGF